MKKTIVAALALACLALTVASRAENILASGSIAITSTNAVTQRIVLDSYKGMQWANVRAIRLHNDSTALANTTAVWKAVCNDLDAGTVLGTGTLIAAGKALVPVNTVTWAGFTNAVGTVTVATNTVSSAPARIVDLTITPDQGVTSPAAHHWHYLIYAE